MVAEGNKAPTQIHCLRTANYGDVATKSRILMLFYTARRKAPLKIYHVHYSHHSPQPSRQALYYMYITIDLSNSTLMGT